MNEEDLDKIFEILEDGYYKALIFAQEESHEDDEETFLTLFKEGLRPYFKDIRDVMIKRAVEFREIK
jgi:hypothetical protein